MRRLVPWAQDRLAWHGEQVPHFDNDESWDRIGRWQKLSITIRMVRTLPYFAILGVCWMRYPEVWKSLRPSDDQPSGST
jgi:hypothetical protein